VLEPGDRVGPYRVIERLGAGGMGEVYSADDTRLQRKVALKILSPDRTEDHDSRERFLREARFASSLDDHPNICSIHDVDVTPQGQPYIVMALASGETLRSRLNHGPIPPDQARDIAIQVARGLAEAHAKRIVHRDIKPENLMVARSEKGGWKVKILDFGIAKGEDVTLTRKGRMVGTVSYMSPEQIRGGETDPRADVWALGAVLYEMLTGNPAFKEDQDLKVMYAVLSQEPEPIPRSGIPVPEDLVRVVTRCLQKDPEKRFSTGAEVLEALVGEKEALVEPPRRLAFGLAAALVILVVAGAFSVWADNTRTGRELVGRLVGNLLGETSYHVAVLPFSASEEADGPLALGLTELFTNTVIELGAITDSVWVAPFDAILATAIRSPEEARRVFQVNRVVRGEVRREEARVFVVVQVIDTEAFPPRTLSETTIPDPSGPTFASEARELISSSLRLRGAGRAIPASYYDSDSSPGRPFYVLGAGHLHDLYAEGNVDNAIALFRAAIEADSDYSPAFAGLCQAHWERFRTSGDPETAALAQSMCDQAVALSTEDPSALAALAQTQLQTGQPQEAEETLLRAQQLSPGSAEVHRWLGRVYEAQGNIDAAEQAYQEAIRIRPEVWLYRSELGIMYANFERHEEAIEQHRAVIRLSPENYLGYVDLGTSLMALNRVAEAEAQFQESIRRRPNTLAYRNLGYLYLRDQRFSEAVEALQSSIELEPEDWWSWRWLAHAQHWRGQEDEARQAWRRVVSLAEPRFSVNRNDQDLLCGLAEAHVALGDERTGRLYLDRLTALSPTTPYNVYWAGRIYEMLGSRDAALELVQRALDRGFDPVTVQQDQWLSNLRQDPRFQEYLAGR